MPRVNVKQIRDHIGISQQELANRMGVHLTTVARWEGGVSDPSPMAIHRLREVHAAHKKSQAPRETSAYAGKYGDEHTDEHGNASAKSTPPARSAFLPSLR